MEREGMHWFWKWVLSGLIATVASRLFAAVSGVYFIEQALRAIVSMRGLPYQLLIAPTFGMVVLLLCWLYIPSRTPVHCFIFWGIPVSLLNYASYAYEVNEAIKISLGDYPRYIDLMFLLVIVVFCTILGVLGGVRRAKYRNTLFIERNATNQSSNTICEDAEPCAKPIVELESNEAPKPCESQPNSPAKTTVQNTIIPPSGRRLMPNDIYCPHCAREQSYFSDGCCAVCGKDVYDIKKPTEAERAAKTEEADAHPGTAVQAEAIGQNGPRKEAVVMKKKRVILWLLVAAMLGTMGWFTWQFTYAPPKPDNMDKVYFCNSRDILRDYLYNYEWAQSYYPDNWHRIKGTISTLEFRPFGLIRVELWGGGGPNTDLRFYLNRDQAKALSSKKVGSDVAIVGYCPGRLLGHFIFTHCEVST